MVTLTSGCHFDNLKHMPQTSALIECKDERWGEGGLCVLSSLTPQVIKMTFTNASLTLQRWSDHPVQRDLTTPQINPPSESLHLGQIFWTHLLRRFHTSLCKRITATGYSRPMCSNTSCTSRNMSYAMDSPEDEQVGEAAWWGSRTSISYIHIDWIATWSLPIQLLFDVLLPSFLAHHQGFCCVQVWTRPAELFTRRW